MFGYIMPQKEELKLKEYYHFRAYYCGLCLALKKRYGQLSRLFLNYDLTFLGILLAAIHENEEKVAYNRCIYTLTKRPMIKEDYSLNFAADLILLLTYHKLQDDWRDEKSYLAKLGIFLLRKNYKKARNNLSAENIIIEENLNKLAELEREKCSDYLKVASVFGAMLQGVIEKRGKNRSEERILGRFYFLLGQWIYLIDAFDDVEKDYQKKAYNPFLLAFDYQGQTKEELAEFKSKIGLDLYETFVGFLAEMAEAYELLEVNKNQEMVENIIYVGMLNKTEELLLNKKGCCQNERLSCSFRGRKRGLQRGDSECV